MVWCSRAGKVAHRVPSAGCCCLPKGLSIYSFSSCFFSSPWLLAPPLFCPLLLLSSPRLLHSLFPGPDEMSQMTWEAVRPLVLAYLAAYSRHSILPLHSSQHSTGLPSSSSPACHCWRRPAEPRCSAHPLSFSFLALHSFPDENSRDLFIYCLKITC